MKIPSPSRNHKLATLLFFGLICFLAVPISFHTVYANDIWKALYSGRYLALFQGFPHHSTFSFSPVKDFLVRDSYNWLGNLVLLGTYASGGVWGLQGFRFFLVLFAVLIPLSFSKYRPNAILLLFAFCYLFGIKQKLILRTAIFVLPGLVMLFWLLMKFNVHDCPRYLWGIPVVFLFWGNMHGSYLAGLMFFLLAWAGLLLDRLMRTGTLISGNTLRMGLIVLLSVGVVTFAKPYPDYKFVNSVYSMSSRVGGLVTSTPNTGEQNIEQADGKDHREAGRTASPTNSGSAKEGQAEVNPSDDGSSSASFLSRIRSLVFKQRTWRSSEFSNPLNRYSFLFVSMTVALFPLGLVIFLVSDRFRFFHFFPILGALLLSLTSLRTIGYFPVILFPITLAKARLGDFRSVKLGRVVHYVSAAAVVILTLNLGFYMFQGRTSQFFGIPELKLQQDFGQRISEDVPLYVLKHYPRERIYTNYNVGGYLIWKWWPLKKVFFDSKGSAYKDEFFREFGIYNQAELMKKNNIDFIINTYRVPFVYNYFTWNSNWVLGAYDSGMVFFGRTSRIRPVDPLKAALFSADEYRSFSRRERNRIRSFVTNLYRQRNVAELKFNRKGKIVPLNAPERTGNVALEDG